MGKTLRIVAMLMAALAVGTVLAEGVGLGYLWSQGMFDAARWDKLVAVAQGKAKVAMPGEESKPDATERTQAVALVDVARARAVQNRDFELREQSLHNQIDEFRVERAKLADEANRYIRVQGAFEKQLDELRAATLSSNAETTRLILENMKPKQAKEQMLHMIEVGSMKEVVALLSAMSPIKRAKVLGEFKTPEESDKLAHILKLIWNGEPELSLIDETKTQLRPAPAE